MDVVEEYLKRVGVNDWRNIIHDLEKWHEVSNGSIKGKIIRLKM